MWHFVLKIKWDILYPTALQQGINEDLKKYEEVVRIHLAGLVNKIYASRVVH